MQKLIIFLSFFLISTNTVHANIKLSRIFQSNMVLQRDRDCLIWGSADASEKLAVSFNGKTYKTIADKKGQWKITLPPQPAGGPYQIVLIGKNTITLDNVLFGDVWLCGGQSNMQFKMSEIGVKEPDSARNNNKNIRIFTVGLATDYKRQDTIKNGEWIVATNDTIKQFSAVAFFFGRYLQEKLHVPIGLISDNLGATAVEEWMGNEALQSFPQFTNYYNEFLAPNQSFKEITDAFEKEKPNWEKNSYLVNDPGLDQKWFLPETNVDDWKLIKTPGYWEDQGLANYDGSVWYRREFELPATYKNEGYSINLGQIDDYAIAWVNGHKVGETFGSLNYANYQVPDSLLHKGSNTLVVRVFDAGGNGGMYNQFWNPSWSGEWKYKPGLKIDAQKFNRPRIVNADLFSSPGILFNGCIAPITNLSIKGVIWYQGESNASRAEEYKVLFPAFIQDWRKQFNQPNLPFLFVQLANYYAETEKPQEAEWAELRESQAAALALENTGMAVAIDIGEANDIHPKNKKDVGERLGVAALKNIYKIENLQTSLLFDHAKILNDSVQIFFKSSTDTLVSKDKYGYLRGFSIAGNDHIFHWAKAFIKNNTVMVYSDKVLAPVAVRYGWSNNPGSLDLYNKQGLPAAPFRTDNWPGATAGHTFNYKK